MPNAVCPMPTTAVRPLIAHGRRYQPLNSDWRRSMKLATPSLPSRVWTLISTSIASVTSRVRAVDVERGVEELLRPADRLRRALREPGRPLVDGRLELGARNHLVHDADALRVGRAEVVAEEHELLRLVQADEAGQQVRDAAVGDEAAPHEHVDQARVVGRDDEIGREREHHAAAGRGAVERAQHRLLAVLDRFHEPLEPGPHHVDRASPTTMSGAPSGFGAAGGRVRRSAPVQKCFSPAAGDDDGPHREVGVRVDEVLDEPVAHVVRDRVARVGPVDREPQHAVLDAREQLFVDRRSGTSGLRSFAHHQRVEGDGAAGCGRRAGSCRARRRRRRGRARAAAPS